MRVIKVAPAPTRRSMTWIRRVLGGMFVAGSATHVVFALGWPHLYEAFGQAAPFATVREAWADGFVPNASELGLVLAGFELALGVLILSGGGWTRIGLVGAAGFHIGLVGFGFWWWSLPMFAVLAVVYRGEATRETPDGPIAVRWTLTAVHALVGVAGLQGAYGLVSDAWQMPTEWLARLPVDTWVLPGIALAVGVGGVQLFAAAALATGHPQAREISLAAGAVLIAWICGQVLVLLRFHPLQPTIAGIGVIEIWLAARLRARAPALQTEAESLKEAA